MTTLDYLEQENTVLRTDLASCRRTAADRNAELARELLDARNALGRVCEELAGEREARRGLARDLAQTNSRLVARDSSIEALTGRLRTVEAGARLLVSALEEGTDREEDDARIELKRALGKNERK